jgi:hypothetical protein
LFYAVDDHFLFYRKTIAEQRKEIKNGLYSL